MDALVEELSRDLFEGNRGKVEARLKDQAYRGQELWLLASATEDHEARSALLESVVASKLQPYAGMAVEILAREAEFAEEMERAPGWQQALLKRKSLLIRLALAIVVLCAITLIGGAILGI